MVSITITPTQHAILTSITNARTSSRRLIFRSNVIMDYESSKNANATAKVHHTSREAIYRWVHRWEESAPLLAQWEIEFKEGSLSEPLYKRLSITHIFLKP